MTPLPCDIILAMEPQLPTPIGGSERNTSPLPESGRYADGRLSETERPTHDREVSAETHEAHEASQGIASGDPVGAFIPPPVPQVDLPGQASPIHDDDVPQEAADVDLIEQEWVKKAKEVVARTQDDPAAQEEAVIRLKVNYRSKRWGNEADKPSSSGG